MKFTKLFLISTVMLLAVCGCRRIQSDLPEHTGKVEMKYLLGTWDEYYDDFEIDESRTWNILEEGIRLHTYNFISGTSDDWGIEYNLGQQDGKNTIKLRYPAGMYKGDDTFVIVKLTDQEMAWQKVGTTFSRESYFTDYLHFVNEKYWKSSAK